MLPPYVSLKLERIIQSESGLASVWDGMELAKYVSVSVYSVLYRTSIGCRFAVLFATYSVYSAQTKAANMLVYALLALLIMTKLLLSFTDFLSFPQSPLKTQTS